MSMRFCLFSALLKVCKMKRGEKGEKSVLECYIFLRLLYCLHARVIFLIRFSYLNLVLEM